MKNKKAVSPIIAYVLLIVIGVSISVMVYNFLKVQIPNQEEKCPEDVHIVVKNSLCDESNNRLNITFQNKGLFNVDGIFLRGVNQSGGAAVTPIRLEQDLNPLTDSAKGFFYFGRGTPNPLSPSEEINIMFIYNDPGIYGVQVQPFIISDKGKLILCSESVINNDIECQ